MKKSRLYTSYVFKRDTLPDGTKVLVQVEELESGTEAIKRAKDLAGEHPGTAFCAGNMWPFVMTKAVMSVVYVDPDDPSKMLKDIDALADEEEESDDSENASAVDESAKSNAKPIVEPPVAVAKEPPKVEAKTEVKTEVKIEAKSETKAEVKSPAKTTPKAEVKDAAKAASKTESNPSGDSFESLFSSDSEPAGFATDDEEKEDKGETTIQNLF